jgi:hypothetical protein
MKTRLKLTMTLITFISLLQTKSLLGQPSIDIETGIVSAGYNNVRIPGDQGTLISLTDDLMSSSSFFYRLRAGYKIRERHNISLLYAPLSVKSDGLITYDVSFAGEVFPAGSSLDAIYKFNSYRLTYRYDIFLTPKVEFGIGFTAKIRDAAISLESPDLFAEKTNIGFVPVINFRVLLNLDERMGLRLEGDALAAPQGRAEDIQIAVQYKVNDNIRMRVGYRLLEGGADNDEVYNFSLFNYACFGFCYTFN